MAGFDMGSLFDAASRQVSNLFGGQDAGSNNTTDQPGSFSTFVMNRPGLVDPMGSMRLGATTNYDPLGASGLRPATNYDPLGATQQQNMLQSGGSFTTGATTSYDPFAWVQSKQVAPTPTDTTGQGTGKEATANRATGGSSNSGPVGLPTDQYRNLIEQAAKEQGIDPDTLEAIMMLESSGDAKAQSSAGAMGLMQVMPFHFRAGEDPWDPATNIRVGARVFAAGYKRYGSYDKAAAAYLGAIDGQGNITTAQDAYGTDGFAYVKTFNTNLATVKQRRQAAAAGNAVAGVGFFPVDGYKGKVDLHWGESTGAADLFAPAGTAIRAIKGGQVVYSGYSDVGGWNVTIFDPQSGLTFYYAHMQNQPNVSTGQTITGGTVIGGVGDTGNAKGTGAHVHVGIGSSIASGTGPNGGAGINADDSPFNATAYLNALLGGR